MRVLIVDDEPSGRAALAAALRGRTDIETVDAVGLAAEASTRLRTEPYDVVLLDLNTPEGGVCALLEILRGIPDQAPSLVFVQAHGAGPALPQEARRSASAPVGSPWIDGAPEGGVHGRVADPAPGCVRPAEPNGNWYPRIGVRSEGRIVFVDPRQVIAVEAQGSYVSLQGHGWAYVLRETISRVAEKLKGLGFVRIHRSTLVNAAFVQEIKPYGPARYGVRVEGGREYPVTRTYKRNLRSLATLWVGADFGPSPRRGRWDHGSRRGELLPDAQPRPSPDASGTPP
jgi:two-component system LytT family response regulator